MTTVTEVVVIGHRTYSYTHTYWGPPGTPSPNLEPDSSSVPPGDGSGCQSTNGMSDDEKRRALVRIIAADIKQKIDAMSNQHQEYGAYIFMKADGTIGSTVLLDSLDFRANMDASTLPKDSNGNPDYSTIVGWIHSHPRYNTGADGQPHDYYTTQDTGYLLRPSTTAEYTARGLNVQGDWDVYQYAIDNLHVDSSKLQIFIAGSNGSTLDLNEYNMSQKNTPNVGDYVDQAPPPLCHPGY